MFNKNGEIKQYRKVSVATEDSVEEKLERVKVDDLEEKDIKVEEIKEEK